jgi:hypothetical protein
MHGQFPHSLEKKKNIWIRNSPTNGSRGEVPRKTLALREDNNTRERVFYEKHLKTVGAVRSIGWHTYMEGLNLKALLTITSRNV